MIVNNNNDWNKLLQQAEEGNTESMNDVAMHFCDGLIIDEVEIVPIDKKASFEWTKKSYKNGNITGMVQYAHHLSDREGKECELNIPLALELYEKAMKAGDLNAAHSLGIEYRNKQEFEKAFEYYCIAQKDADFYADLSIGLCYYYGIGVLKDKKRAFEIFTKIDPESSTAYEVNEINYLLGKINLEGEIVEKNIDKARQYLELANEDGDHRSALELLLIIGRSALIN